MEIIIIIVAIAVLVYLYKNLFAGTTTVQFKAYATRKEAMEDAHPLSSGNRFDQEVVGESFYQDILRKIVAALPAGHEYVQATLVMENDNPHDSNAVAV